MNCEVSSIQPASSTAPARKNISQGERASRAPAASAAVRDPAKRRKRQPATSATRSITPLSMPSTSSTSRTTPAAAPGTSAANVATVGCSTPSVGMITLSIEPRAPLQHEKRLHCYHLVTVKSAGDLRLFAANGRPRARGCHDSRSKGHAPERRRKGEGSPRRQGAHVPPGPLLRDGENRYPCTARGR